MPLEPLVVAGALAGASLASSARAESADTFSPGVHLTINFGQGVRVGLGVDLRYTHALDAEGGECAPRPAWTGLGAFAQATWLIHDGLRVAVGPHVAAELQADGMFVDFDLAWTWTEHDDVRGHGVQLGFMWGGYPLDLVVARSTLTFADDRVRPEAQLGVGARLIGIFGDEGTSCIVGRPLRVGGVVRRAPCALGRGVAPRGLDDAARVAAVLGHDWLAAAEGEAASVPAFIALARDLVTLDAPRTLVARALAAARDEVRHARACAALASRALGCTVTPVVPPLPAADATAPREALVARVVAESWRDGCLGEGAAAARAHDACAVASASRPALARIAKDERAHAELAWSVLTFMCAARDDIGEVARDALADIVAATASRAACADRPAEAVHVRARRRYLEELAA